MMNFLLLYLSLLSIASFVFFGVDKYKAQKNKPRISENFLLLIILLGGSLGAIAGMIIFRHKISKSSFLMKILVIIIIHILLLYFF